MKKTYQACLFLLFCSVLPRLSAQVCTPDPAYTSPGIYPASIPATCVDEFYETTVTVVIPVDTTITSPFPLTVPVDSVVLNDVLGIPAGMSFACAPAGCSFPGGSAGCVQLSGTATTPGVYDLDLITTYHVLTPLGPVAFPDTAFAYYTLTVNAGVNAVTSSTPANCGQADGSVSVDVQTGTGPFDILWSTGDTTEVVDNLAAGAYPVTITDANGCSFSTSATVGSSGAGASIDSAMSVIAWTGCAADSGGSILPEITGGVLPYAYLWSTGDTTASLDGVSGGNYTLTVTDANGCAATQSYPVEAPDSLSISASNVENVLCAGGEDGFISFEIAGGNAPYTYEWDGLPNETNPELDNLMAGSYLVTVTDENDCAFPIDFDITEPDSLSLSLSGTDETPDFNDGTASVAVMGGNPDYSYLWSTGATTDSISGLTGGIYTVVVTDENGCEIEGEIDIAFGISGVDESWVQDFSLYPNPSRGTVQFSFSFDRPQAFSLELYNLHGQLLRREQPAPSVQYQASWELTSLPSGVYTLFLRSGERQLVRKLVRE